MMKDIDIIDILTNTIELLDDVSLDDIGSMAYVMGQARSALFFIRKEIKGRIYDNDTESDDEDEDDDS